LISTGVCTQLALQAANQLDAKGIATTVLHIHTIKPLDWETVRSLVARVPMVLTIEENTLIGGLGTAVAEIIAEAEFNPPKRFERLGLPDQFPDQYGSQSSLMASFQITAQNAFDKVMSYCSNSGSKR
jgi:transketolase